MLINSEKVRKGLANMKTIKRYKDKIALLMILCLAGFLSAYHIQDQGYSNEFYAASVKSMLVSWKNFFFVSLDPGGWVTVDKPPVSLWVQAAFAKVFGFSGWSILLPEALAAVASVLILYHIVKRHFGAAAGLLSALALALSPIFIVISKTNNTDSVLILFMLLSAWAMSVAADTGKLRYLVLSAVLLGVAYNAKTLEAFLILPALFAVYLFGTNLKWRTRAWHLGTAFLVLAVVSLSWSVLVDLTPASERPYVDNSTSNSELELAIGYNGIQRITGQNGGGRGGSFAPKSRDAQTTSGEAKDDGVQGNPSSSPSASGGDSEESPAPGGFSQNSFEEGIGSPPSGMNGGSSGRGFGGGNSFNGGGSASPLRMFNTTLGGQDSWLLPFGLFTLLALILRMRGESDREKRRKLLCDLLMWGGSVVTMVGYFSVANFFHPYYISAMAPFLAALVGIGAVEMRELYRRGKASGYILPAALAATLAAQIFMLRSYPSFAKILIPLIAVIAGVPTLLLFVLKPLGKGSDRLGTVCMSVVLAGLLIAPAVWLGYSVFTNNINSSIPSAGPSASEASFSGNAGGFNVRPDDGGDAEQGDRYGDSGEGGNLPSGEEDARSPAGFGQQGGGMQNRSGSSEKLIRFLEANNTGEKWLIAVPDAAEAEPIILATGKPVIAVGGFSGNDNTLTAAKLEELVASGQLKYFLLSDGGRGISNSEVTSWIKQYGTAVDSAEWSDSSASGFGGRENAGTLYDLSSYRASSKTSSTAGE